MSSNAPVPPPISWAQRNQLLYVIVNVECQDTEYKFTEDTMFFKGTSVVGNQQHEVTLNFLHKINPETVITKNISRCMEFTIFKKEIGSYWPTLTNDKKKPHFLKVDFNKWVEEGSDTEDLPRSMSDVGKGFDGYYNNDNSLMDMLGGTKPDGSSMFDIEDSDDEEIPNLIDSN